MSRADVFVDADRAKTHLLDPTVVFAEGDADVSAADTGVENDDGSHLPWSYLPDMPVHTLQTADRSAS